VNEPRWIDLRVILSVHDMQSAEHGGLPGIRDSDLLESTQLHTYNSDATLWQMGAAYAFGISSNRPFADGNKRTAFMAAFIFFSTMVGS
jgi:death-on-curing protein